MTRLFTKNIMIYNKIVDFCAVRNVGNCYKNGVNPTPRVEFILDLLESEGIEYELDTFSNSNNRHSVVRKKHLSDFNSHSDRNRIENTI